ncbi:MAG TPA: hypothetical protein VD996_17470 [Chitinophagaceae bacterium]|nr:hypothetical protein [Chitinophagaceae bacterium]
MKLLTIKNGARVALIILLLDIAGNLVAYCQAKYQLTSPLIPPSTILELTEPFIKRALLSTATCVIALLLYFFHQYIITVILCGVILLASRLLV